jgi:heterodisulfide reductase subunit A
MMDVGRHPNITLLTYSEVESVSGYVGNFQVRVVKHPRYVDATKCTACGDCVQVCPIALPDAFNEGLSQRRAIYRPHAQAVPNAYLVSKRGTSPCKAACPADTSAQGYIALIAQGRYEEALEVIKQYNPFPATVGRVCDHKCETECNRGKVDRPVSICALKRFVADRVYAERACEALTSQPPLPSLGEVEGAERAGRSATSDEPASAVASQDGRRVAIMGAGPAGLSAAHFLASMGHRVTIFEALPVSGGMMRVGIPAYRLPRDVLQREIDDILALGVELRLNTAISDINGLFDQGYEALFLAIGAHEPQLLRIPGEDAAGVFHGIDFLRDVNLGREVKLGQKVVVVWGGNTAVDAARCALRLGAEEVVLAYRRSRDEMPANSWEVEEAEREGITLQLLTQPIEVLSENGRVRGIRCVRMRLGRPDDSGRRRPIPVEGSGFVIEADALIAAVAQAPETSFLKPDHGLEVTPWGTFVVNPQTLETNRPGVFAGGDSARGPGALIQAIADGRRAALSIDRTLRGEPLLTPRELQPLPTVRLTDQEIAELVRAAEVNAGPREVMPTEPVKERIRDFREVELGLTEEQACAEALRCLRCGICAECWRCVEACGVGCIDHQMAAETVELDVGAVVVATGFAMWDPTQTPEYGYGKSPNIITNLEFERLISASGPTGGEVRTAEGKKPERVAFIHCVGSRDERAHPYCSRFCCMVSLKQAHQIRDKTGAEVYDFYMDMRTFGKAYEEFYGRVRSEGIHFIQGRPSQVTVDPVTQELFVEAEDILLGKVVEIPVDMVVLATAIEPHPDADRVAATFGIGRTPDGFFAEAHPKLQPVQTSTAGVFLAGSCQGPRDVPDTVVHAGAAALEAVRLFNQGQVTISPTVATVNTVACVGCGECIPACPYAAISRNVDGDVKRRAEINPALCQGCGTCVATCPSGAITALHFTDEEIVAQIDGLLAVMAEA